MGDKYGFTHNGGAVRKIPDEAAAVVAAELLPHAKGRRPPNADAIYHTYAGARERHNEGLVVASLVLLLYICIYIYVFVPFSRISVYSIYSCVGINEDTGSE